MTWYVVSPGAGNTHHGVLVRGQVQTDCGEAFATTACVRLELEPGERPSEPEVCPLCVGEAR